MADEPTDTKVESDPEQPGGEVTLAAATTAARLINELVERLGDFREGAQRANTAIIAYMDRVVLLAGGTLTLIFTVLGSVSAHLYEMHQQARHIPFVLTTCWLLVTSIITGLVYNSAAIQVGQLRDAEHTLQHADARLKLELLSQPNLIDVSKLPPIPGMEAVRAKLKTTTRVALVSGLIAQTALMVAFIFLASFIQSNISLMLAAPQDQPPPAATSHPAPK